MHNYSKINLLSNAYYTVETGKCKSKKVKKEWMRIKSFFSAKALANAAEWNYINGIMIF